MAELVVGTAGWTVPAAVADRFPAEGSGLERYAARFGCAEINSSFHRSHRAATWQRWANAVPDDFRFSAKLSRTITHQRKLVDCEVLLEAAVAEMTALGPKLAIILVQLPPSLAFDKALADRFFTCMRGLWDGSIACEPRHASWFGEDAVRLLVRHRAARVAADPVRVEEAARPGGWRGLTYYRLHGSPVAYRSSYDDGRLEAYAAQLAADEAPRRWCIFDNTASSAAAGDALKLQSLIG